MAKKKKIKEIKVPMKFNLGTLKFEPEINKKQIEDIEKWKKKQSKKQSKQGK